MPSSVREESIQHNFHNEKDKLKVKTVNNLKALALSQSRQVVKMFGF